MERPALNRRSSSRRSQNCDPLTSPPNSPPQHKRLHKVGGFRGANNLHSRVPSTQKLKSQIQHGADGEPIKRANSFSKLTRNASTTSLKRPQSTLKRNKSAAEVRLKASGPLRRQQLNGHKAAVHFDVGLEVNGDPNEDADGWTEASNSASPVVSRKSSVGRLSSGLNAARPSANNSRPQSPTLHKSYASVGGDAAADSRDDGGFQTPNATQITSKLLNRIPSQSAAPKMSTISATVTPSGRSPESVSKSQGSTQDGNSNPEKPQISRFIGATSGTPSDSSFLSNGAKTALKNGDLNQSKRAMSMGNLTRKPDPSSSEAEEERALAPRCRKTSTTSFNPALSRTQQKQWLQRASSAIEPQQLSRDRFANIPPFGPGNPLIGTSYDGRDPRVRAQLERTGLEYLVVRRYQNPVGAAIRRLERLPEAENWVRIPSTKKGKSATAGAAKKDAYGSRTRPLSENLGVGTHHVVGSSSQSQILKEVAAARHSVDGGGGGGGSKTRSSYDAGKTPHAGEDSSHGDLSGSGGEQRGTEEERKRDGVKEMLRRIWETTATQD